MAKEDFEGIDFGDFTPSEKIMEFKGVGALAKSYEELRTDNSSKIKIPGEDAADDEKTAFTSTLREHLGINPPKTAEEYTWKPPEGMESRFEGMADQLKKYHEAGYDDTTVSLMMQEQADAMAAATSAMQEKQKQIADESKAALSEKWGDDFEANMKSANAMESRFPDLFALMKDLGVANNQSVVEAMYDISMSVSEDTPPNNDSAKIKGMREELDTLKAHPSYMKGNHPDHEKTMARIREIQKGMPR